eukprot:3795031-Amphidinium_carterae.1
MGEFGFLVHSSYSPGTGNLLQGRCRRSCVMQTSVQMHAMRVQLAPQRSVKDNVACATFSALRVTI